MAQVGLAVSTILLLGTISTTSARTVYAQAYGYPYGAPRVQQDVQAYGHPDGATRLQQEIEAIAQLYNMETQQYDMKTGNKQEFYAIEQQETCLGGLTRVTNLPYLQGEICSVSQNQCGWLKFSVRKPFLRYHYGAPAQVNADMQVCQRGSELCYKNIDNDCSRLPYPSIRTPVSIPTPFGRTTVIVVIQEPPQICLHINIPKCSELL